MAETSYVVILVTASSNEEARKIADRLLTERKAACVSIVPGVNSLFWWQERLSAAEECLLIVKTKGALLPEVVSLVKGLHSYEMPEVVAFPVIGGNPEYLAWIDRETWS
ncbi:MAG: divalent-cation tolerance protein CutA [Chloroflexi bacterium]|nr:divalent-cation tolerance protein CutA [Chloroflexota bacterium]